MQGALGDQVLRDIANQLKDIAVNADALAVVGGESHAHCLLKPLELLCQVDETEVRNAAIRAAKDLYGHLSTPQKFQYLVPMALRLVRHHSKIEERFPPMQSGCSLLKEEWFPPMQSGCSLFALAYQGADTARSSSLKLDNPAEVGLTAGDPDEVR